MHKFLDVSVDFNPVLFVDSIPDEINTDCSLLQNIKEKGLYVIPKHCQKIHGVPSDWSTLPGRSDLWRYSVNHWEAEIMQSLPLTARECYMLCKSLRMEPMTCCVQGENRAYPLTGTIATESKFIIHIHHNWFQMIISVFTIYSAYLFCP